MGKANIWTKRCILGLLGIILACGISSSGPVGFIPIPDFEPQESTLICWNLDYQSILVPLITKISQKDHITLFYNENYYQPQEIVRNFHPAQARLSQILLSPFKLDKNNIWIRDYGPNFLQDTYGNDAILGFSYPHEEFVEYTQFSEKYATRMKIPFYKSKLKGTGGGREINGKGTIILIEGYEKEINPGKTKAEIEQVYKNQFNQKEIIWLKRGIPQDDLPTYGPIIDNIYGTGANWHVDEFCRFADAKTILLAKVDSADLERDIFYQLIHHRLEENYLILSRAKDQDGNPFTIKRIPQAPVIFAAGKLMERQIYYAPVTSYLNFVITNNQVIMPAYAVGNDPEYISEKDQAAAAVLQEAFPTREVSMINATSLNYKGGGLHCITLSKPGKRFERAPS